MTRDWDRRIVASAALLHVRNRRPSLADRRKSLKQKIIQDENKRLNILAALNKRIQPFVEMLQFQAA